MYQDSNFLRYSSLIFWIFYSIFIFLLCISKLGQQVQLKMYFLTHFVIDMVNYVLVHINPNVYFLYLLKVTLQGFSLFYDDRVFFQRENHSYVGRIKTINTIL